MNKRVDNQTLALGTKTVKDSGLRYMTGFGNEFETEALPGVLPKGQNSPQKVAYGLYSELFSGTTFPAPRAQNRRTYMFRIHPSVQAPKYARVDNGLIATPPFNSVLTPNNMRWDPFEIGSDEIDFVEGLATMCGNGGPLAQSGMAMHIYRATASMKDKVFTNNDGEMIIVPQQGTLRLFTEMGILEIEPGEIAIVPKGIRFRAELPSGPSRGFVCENFSIPFQLPELGLIGSNGLANASDFMAPVAAYEDKTGRHQLVQKYCGNLWATELSHSPLDVVAWRGRCTPVKYNTENFVALGTATVDHPDPSIFCALTSGGDPLLGPNADMLVLPPRWMVAEHSFRPPGFHRNAVCEVVTLIKGMHQGKTGGFNPGGISIHNNFAPHGPDVKTFTLGRVEDLVPKKLEGTIAILWETRFPLALTKFALEAKEFQSDVIGAWQGFDRLFSPDRP